MSYNISNVKMLRSTLRLPKENFQMMWDLLRCVSLPECHFMRPFLDHIRKWPRQNGPIEPIGFDIPSVQWLYSGSGHSFEDSLPRIVALLEGEADFLFIWEGGDSLSGHIIRDGKLYIVEYEYRLIIPEVLPPPVS